MHSEGRLRKKKTKAQIKKDKVKGGNIFEWKEPQIEEIAPVIVHHLQIELEL